LTGPFLLFDLASTSFHQLLSTSKEHVGHAWTRMPSRRFRVHNTPRHGNTKASYNSLPSSLSFRFTLDHNSSIDIMADTNEEINQDSILIFLAMVIALLAIVPALLIRLVLYLLGFGQLGPVTGKHLQSFPSFSSPSY
jgi:hypothetical protein